jgi:hypothetical protein
MQKMEQTAKIPPYPATSLGNQKSNSNNPKLLSIGDQGI